MPENITISVTPPNSRPSASMLIGGLVVAQKKCVSDCSSTCRVKQRHAGRHQAVGNRQRRRPRRRASSSCRPRLRGTASTISRRRTRRTASVRMSTTIMRAPVDDRRQDARQRLDADVAAIRLDVGAAQEHRADDAEHRRLVLPVGRGLEQIAREDAVGQTPTPRAPARACRPQDHIARLIPAMRPRQRAHHRPGATGRAATWLGTSRPWLTRA